MFEIRNKIIVWYALASIYLLPALVLAEESDKTDDLGKGTFSLIPCAGPDCGLDDLVLAVQGFIDFLLVYLAPPVVVLLFLYAGWLYLTAGANTGQGGKAKNLIGAVIGGILIMLFAWLIIHFITDSLLTDAFKTPVPIN